MGLLPFLALALTPTSAMLPPIMTQYAEDRAALLRLYTFPYAESRHQALTEHLNQTEQNLKQISFANLSADDKADWRLMQIEIAEQQESLRLNKQHLTESASLHPFLPRISALFDHRISRSLPNAQSAAQEVNELTKEVKTHAQILQDKLKNQTPEQIAPENVALRAINVVGASRRSLDEWFRHFDGYDPLFSWWTKKPYEDCQKELASYETFLKKELTGRDTDPNKIVGDPVGREALVAALGREMIDYTPEELIQIAESEMAWVDKEFDLAAKELGYSHWRDALELVKTKYVEPGQQPKLIRELAEEAIEYLESNKLLTIPPLAKQVWRMDMMSAERQLVSPFFLGGESIIISFPTDEMTYDQKVMSLKANNRYFAKATVHHELIPGHHMQFFMTSRYNTHRAAVSGTPFWVEGWALYWEFLLYKRGFAATPEERIGFLFWRKHRCARIIFSLKFHLGQMTAPECVKMLTDVVGHEQSTAEGEVRRSFGGTYPPLYQAAYMLGALQLWQIRRELVDTGKIPERDFHDQILQLGNMPWAVVRDILSKNPIERTAKPWRFYNGPVGN
jgi:uncharacterized protein (DUF885 family)